VVVAATVTVTGLVAGPPAFAGGVVVSASPDVVAPDGTISVTGSGCPAGSTITSYVWDTAGSPTYLEANHTVDGAGAFGFSVDLEESFGPGRELGVGIFCATTRDPEAPFGSDFVRVAAEEPTVRLSLPLERVGYHQPVQVVMRVIPNTVSGVAHVFVDGDSVGAVLGDWDGRTTLTIPDDELVLDRPLSLGVHRVRVVFDPFVEGPDDVARRVDLTVVKSSARLRLGFADDRVPSTRRARAVLDLRVPGWERPTGVVLVKRGTEVLVRTRLAAADEGSTSVLLPRLPRGDHRLRAVYLGTRVVRSDRSPVALLTVVRPR
jgi:hypothetical protein